MIAAIARLVDCVAESLWPAPKARDGAAVLTEREAEEEVAEPAKLDIHEDWDGNPGCQCGRWHENVVAQLAQLTYFAEDIRNILNSTTVPPVADDSPAGGDGPLASPAGPSTWYPSASLIRVSLRRHFNTKNLGVLVDEGLINGATNSLLADIKSEHDRTTK